MNTMSIGKARELKTFYNDINNSEDIGTANIVIDENIKSLNSLIDKIIIYINSNTTVDIILTSTNYELLSQAHNLLKNYNVHYNLYDDFNDEKRSYIDLSFIDLLPFAYINYLDVDIKKTGVCFREKKHIVRGSIEISTTNFDLVREYTRSIALLISKYNNLDDIDKIILVANFIQSKIQYASGVETTVKDVTYQTLDFDKEKNNPNNLYSTVRNSTGFCSSINRLAFLILNNTILKVKCRIASLYGNHEYLIINLDGKYYACDFTWCITRNEDRKKEALMSNSFSSKYLFLGMESLSNEELAKHHLPIESDVPFKIEEKDLGRDIIDKEVQMLSKQGVMFSYDSVLPLESTVKEKIK